MVWLRHDFGSARRGGVSRWQELSTAATSESREHILALISCGVSLLGHRSARRSLDNGVHPHRVRVATREWV